MYEITKPKRFFINFCVFLQLKNRDCVSQHPQQKLFPYQWGLLGLKYISNSSKWHSSHSAASILRFEKKETQAEVITNSMSIE